MFRTVAGTKLDAATANAVVAFEVDGGTERNQGDGAWSVLVRGVAREVNDPAALQAARALASSRGHSTVRPTISYASSRR